MGYDFLPLFNPYTLQPTPAADYADSIDRSKTEFFKYLDASQTKLSPAVLTFVKNQIESARVELKVTLGLLDICKKTQGDSLEARASAGIADEITEKLRKEKPISYAEGYAQNANALEALIEETETKLEATGFAAKLAQVPFNLDFDSDEITLRNADIGSPAREQHNWEFTHRVYNLKHALCRTLGDARVSNKQFVAGEIKSILEQTYKPVEINFRIYKPMGAIEVRVDYAANNNYIMGLIPKTQSTFFARPKIKEIAVQLGAAKLEQNVLAKLAGLCAELNLGDELQDVNSHAKELSEHISEIESSLGTSLLEKVSAVRLGKGYLGPAMINKNVGYIDDNLELLQMLLTAKALNVYSKPELPARLNSIMIESYADTFSGFQAYVKKWGPIFADAAKGCTEVKAWTKSGLLGAVQMMGKDWEKTKKDLHESGIITDAEEKELNNKN